MRCTKPGSLFAIDLLAFRLARPILGRSMASSATFYCCCLFAYLFTQKHRRYVGQALSSDTHLHTQTQDNIKNNEEEYETFPFYFFCISLNGSSNDGLGWNNKPETMLFLMLCDRVTSTTHLFSAIQIRISIAWPHTIQLEIWSNFKEGTNTRWWDWVREREEKSRTNKYPKWY